jgi:hypothetical protein
MNQYQLQEAWRALDVEAARLTENRKRHEAKAEEHWRLMLASKANAAASVDEEAKAWALEEAAFDAWQAAALAAHREAKRSREIGLNREKP